MVGIFSHFMQKICDGHWNATKRVLIHLKGTQELRLKYSKLEDFKLIRYTDSNFYGDKENGVSTSIYIMSLGSIAITWR